MKVVLAGAFGNLGAEILKCLCADGHEVIAADLRETAVEGCEGKYTFSNGNYISGTFENNKVKEGTYHIKTKEYECVASVVSHQLSNKVKLTLATGEIYDGEIKNGKFDGQGKLTLKDGSVYEGNFSSNKRSGTGTYTWKSGECYVGSWKDDKMDGSGVYYYDSIYSTPKLEGTFKNGVPTGECTYYKNSYTTFTTTWKNGKCTRVAED